MSSMSNEKQVTISAEEEKMIAKAVEAAIDTLDGRAVGVVVHVFWKGGEANRLTCSTGLGLGVDPSTEVGGQVVLSMMADVPRIATEWANRMKARLGLGDA